MRGVADGVNLGSAGSVDGDFDAAIPEAVSFLAPLFSSTGN